MQIPKSPNADADKEYLEDARERGYSALDLVNREINHQIEKGYTPEHDRQHTGQELILAGGTYISSACFSELEEQDVAAIKDQYPFEIESLNLDRTTRDLVKGIALLTAEVNRRLCS